MPSLSPLSPVVNKLHELVLIGPTHFEITILPLSKANDESTTELSLEDSLIVVQDKFLGMDARSLPWITRAVRKDYRRVKENLASSDYTAPSSLLIHKQLLKITTCLMLVNPDHSTAWADRRRCLIQLSNDWNFELDFVNLLMSQHSKAPSSWGHRKYILQQIIKSIRTMNDWNSEDCFQRILNLVRKEIQVCSKIAERFPKNYYAWTHRRYLWTICILPNVELCKEKDILDHLFRDEFEKLSTWLKLHISDHSAVHYQCQVLELWMQHTYDDTKLLNTAKLGLQNAQILIYTHPDHESLWILRRLVLRILLDQSKNRKCSDAIRLLLLGDIDRVYQETIEYDTATIDSSKTIPYGLTFLAWSMMQLRSTTIDFSDSLNKITSMLRSHPHVTHRMWSLHGSRILNTS